MFIIIKAEIIFIVVMHECSVVPLLWMVGEILSILLNLWLRYFSASSLASVVASIGPTCVARLVVRFNL